MIKNRPLLHKKKKEAIIFTPFSSMHLQEYQSKILLDAHSIPTPPFAIASNEKQIEEAIGQLDLHSAIIKAQILSGGRGKAGGIKRAKGRDRIIQSANDLLGSHLTTAQSGGKSLCVDEVMITECVDIDSEFYLGVMVDRSNQSALLLASRQGGVDIEQVSKTAPEQIIKEAIPLTRQLREFQLRRILDVLGWKGETACQGKRIIHSLIDLFFSTDAILWEINPLVKTKTGQLLALDAKSTLDDHALFRQERVKTLLNLPAIKESISAFNYVQLEGNIGCMVNGAGLAMATLDMIAQCGGKPANFLDIGGGATSEKISKGFALLSRDPRITVFLVHIFGGIVSCMTVAQGILFAIKENWIQHPLVICMEGTQVEEGKQLLSQADHPITVEENFSRAINKAISLA